MMKCRNILMNILFLSLFGIGSLFAQTKVSDISEEGKIIKVAAAQILSNWDIDHNEEKITDAVIEAAKQGCEVILFHEGCLTNFPVGDDIKRIDFEKVRAAERRILSLSREHHIAILLGSSSEEEGSYYNHVVIADEHGKILGRYIKTWRAGEKSYEAGSGPVIFTVAGVEATVIICHDLRYPELARLGVASGAQIVFIANNESVLVSENKLLGYRSMQIARATESMVYSVMANAPADPEDVDRYNCSHGNSKIVDPLGNIVDEAGSFEERLVIGELELERAHRSTVLRTIGENEKINEYYDVECENLPYRNWMREGLKLVVRLDGTDVPAYLTVSNSEPKSSIHIQGAESAWDKAQNFATLTNEQHPDNRIGYRFHEHHPSVYGSVPESAEEAGINVDEIARMENAIKNQEGVYIHQRHIQEDSLWSEQSWTFYMNPVQDGVEILFIIETDERGLPEYYGIQQCFRMSGASNAEWRKHFANTPAFSEYDLWKKDSAKYGNKSLTFVVRNGEWQEIPATSKTLGARTPLGIEIDSKLSNGKLMNIVGPYKAEMLLPIDNGLITRTDLNNSWICGVHWENTSHVTDHHPADCLHSVVNIGNIPPFSKRAIRGKIYWFKGSKQDLLWDFQRDFPSKK